MNKKYTIEFVRKEFEKEAYILLTKKYKNAHQKLEYICPKGHKHSTCWGDWQQGVRCSYCAGVARLSISFIRKEFKKEGYILIATEYKNSKQKLDVVCPEGHEYAVRWNDWQQGYRCPHCAGNIRLNIDFIRKEFEKENYGLLTKYYRNSDQKLYYICPEGHKRGISWHCWQQGQRCLLCFKENNRGENHPMWRGGISCEPYCELWVKKKFKEMIKERDGYGCQSPVCKKVNFKLVVHHIDYDKKNCDPSNLITLCNSCNVMANKDRKWHTKWYQLMLNKKYGYIYSCIRGDN